MNLRLLSAIAAIALLSSPVSLLRSQIVQVDNTGNSIYQFEFVNSGLWEGEAFTTGSSGGLTISSVNLLEPTVVPGLTLSLYSNSSSNPGTSLGTFNLSTSSGSGGDYTITYTPTSTLNLSASTEYWLVLSSTGSSGAWASSNLTTYASNNGWTIDTANFAQSVNGGTSWDLTTGSSGGGNTLQFSVTTTSSVPEPSTWMLLLLGGVGLGWFARRRIQA